MPELIDQGSSALVRGDFLQAAQAFNAIQANYSEEPIWLEGQLPAKILPLAGLASHKSNLQAEAISALQSYLANYVDSLDSEIFARYTLASSLLLDEQREAAQKAFAELREIAGDSPFRDLAALREAQLSETPRAIEILQEIVAHPSSPRLANFARLRLIQLLLETNDLQAARIQLLDTNWQRDSISELASLSFLAATIADQLATDDPQNALRAYQLISPKNQLILAQETRIAQLQQQFRDLAPALKTEQSMWSDQFHHSIKQLRHQLENLRDSPDYQVAIDLRKARCFAQLNRPLEAWILLQPIARSQHELSEVAHLEWISVARSMRAWNHAAIIARDFIASYPENKDIPQILLWIALSQMEQGNYSGATLSLQSLLHKTPPLPVAAAAYYYLGFCLFNQGQSALAIKAFKSSRQTSPQSPVAAQAHLWIGICQFTTNDLEDALTTFHAIQSDTTARFIHPEASFRETACYYALGELDQALEMAQRWTSNFAKHARSAEVHLLQGDILSELNQVDEALLAYARVESADPHTHFLALKKRSILLIESGKNNEALVELEAFRSASPVPPEFIGDFTSLLAACLAPRVAQLEIAAAVESHGNNLQAQGIVELLLNLDSLPQADPERPALSSRILVAEILALRQKNQLTEAKIKALQLASQFDIRQLPPEALAEAGKALAEISSLEAPTYFQRILDEYPDFPDIDAAYTGLAIFYAHTGDPGTALSYLLQASNPDLEALSLRLSLEKELQQFENARKTAEEILAERQTPPVFKAQALQALAEIARKQGELDQAYAYYQRIFTLYRGETKYVADSYLNCIQILDASDRTSDAKRVASEFLAQSDLQQQAAYHQAQAWYDAHLSEPSIPETP